MKGYFLFSAPARALAIGIISICLVSCGKDGAKKDAPAPGIKDQVQKPVTPDPVKPGEPAFPPPPDNPAFPHPPAPEPPNLVLGPPAWGVSAERKPWNNAVLAVIRERLPELERAKDVEDICPGYKQASARQRENCWLLLVAGISKFESNFKPESSFREPSGEMSVGLLALSANQCPNAPNEADLKNAVKNLICGTNKLAKLVGRDSLIDGSQMGPDGKVLPPVDKNGRPPFPGATAYWSTLKPRHKKWDPTRNRWLTLGYKSEIAALVRGYRGSSAKRTVAHQELEGVVAFMDGKPVKKVSYSNGLAVPEADPPALPAQRESE